MLMFNYFISYAHPGGFGNVDIQVDRPIESITGVRELERIIAKDKPELSKVVIIAFQLLGTTEI